MPLSRSRDLISSITTDSVCRELAACVKSRASTMCPAAPLDKLDLRARERARADANSRLRTVGPRTDQDAVHRPRRRRP